MFNLFPCELCRFLKSFACLFLTVEGVKKLSQGSSWSHLFLLRCSGSRRRCNKQRKKQPNQMKAYSTYVLHAAFSSFIQHSLHLYSSPTVYAVRYIFTAFFDYFISHATCQNARTPLSILASFLRNDMHFLFSFLAFSSHVLSHFLIYGLLWKQVITCLLA